MIRLKQIDINGFRAFQKPFHVSFASPQEKASNLVVVAGPNGMGKTSLLEAILLVLGREDLIRRTLPPGAPESHWRATVPDGATLSVTLEVGSVPGTELGPLAPCELELTRTAAIRQARIRKSGEAEHQDFSHPDEFVRRIPVEYYSSWRLPFQMGMVKPSTRTTQFPQSEPYRLFRLKQRIVDERAARGFSEDATKDSEWLEKLNKVWTAWHGTDKTFIDARIVEDADRLFDLCVMQKKAFGTEPVCSVDQTSSGELEWLTLAGSLIVDDFSGLLLIDEPELHLHPQWQARLLPTLQQLSPKAQLVLATHSPFPWDQSLSFQRVLLLPEGDPRRQPLAENGDVA